MTRFELDENHSSPTFGDVLNAKALEVSYPQELKDLIKKREGLVHKQKHQRFKKAKAKMEKDFKEKGESNIGFVEIVLETIEDVQKTPTKKVRAFN